LLIVKNIIDMKALNTPEGSDMRQRENASRMAS
jgi:hypothetical protein